MPISRTMPGIAIASILFLTDFSPASAHAFPLATALARRYSAKLLFVHVIPHQVHPEDFTFGPAASLEDRASAEHKMKSLMRSDLLRGLDCSTIIVEGLLGESLDRVLHDHRIDVAVVGTSAATGMRRLLFGSGAEQIYRHASCPVMVVGPSVTYFEGPGDFETILVPVDFSKGSLSALPYAELLAGQHGRIVLVHVLSAIDPRSEAAMVRDCNQRLRGLVSEPLDKGSRAVRRTKVYDLTCVTGIGEEPEIILKHADESGAGVIVMGVYPTRRPAAQVPWNTVRAVVRTAQCPVLVIKYSGAS